MNPDDRNYASAPEPSFHGARWAAILGAALLVAMALFTSARWFAKPATDAEQIVPIPLPVVAPTPTPRPEDFAPDPGDTP